MFMEIEDVKSDNPQKSDLVVEARELLSEVTLPAEMNARAIELLPSLCAELEQLRSQHSVQAQSIVELQKQEKVMRAAIEAALDRIEALYNTNLFTSSLNYYGMREQCTQLRAAITPKGEQTK